jgi:hypothetical protein
MYQRGCIIISKQLNGFAMNVELKARLYNKLQADKIKINWNKNPIRMDKFLSFLTISVERRYDHLGSSTGWTKLQNKEHELVIYGGVVGIIEYLDSVQYGVKLSNQYNNYVNPFYLFDILTKEGQSFFLEYYANEIDEIVTAEKDGITFQERKLAHSKKIMQDIEQEIEFLKSNCKPQANEQA